jgi:hypothetical protein
LSDAARNTDDNLQFVRKRIVEGEDALHLLNLYQNILIEKRVLANEFDPVKCALLLSGLVKADDQKILRVRNAMYRNIFASSWVRAVQLRMQQGGGTQ